MNIKKEIRIIFIMLVILVMLCGWISVTYAATTQELRDQQSDLDSKIEQTNTEIAGVKSQMSAALSQINSLN